MVDRRDAIDPSGDPRWVPAYGLSEAAHYLRIPVSTLRAWLAGQYYPTSGGRALFRPVIRPAGTDPLSMSFINLVEAHLLRSIRQEHGVPLPKVRSALSYLGKTIPGLAPLARHRFMTNGIDLFIERLGNLVNVSQQGQLHMRRLMLASLHRIEWGDDGLPSRLYPFTREPTAGQPKAVVIDPTVSFGRPTLKGTGVPTRIIAQRFLAGDSLPALARDYGRTRDEIEEALRCEIRSEAA